MVAGSIPDRELLAVPLGVNRLYKRITDHCYGSNTDTVIDCCWLGCCPGGWFEFQPLFLKGAASRGTCAFKHGKWNTVDCCLWDLVRSV